MKKTVIRVFALLLVFSMLFGCAPMAEVSSAPEAESVPVSSDSISAEVSSAARSAQSPAETSSKNTSSAVSSTQSVAVKPEKSQKQLFSESISDFGLTMLAQMPRDGKSTVLSPVSLAVPLSLLANGARGQSYDELAAVLGIEDITEYNKQFAAYQEFLNENSGYNSSEETGSEKSYLKYGNSIWIEKKLIFHNAFLDVNDLYYGSKLTSLDFSYPSAATQQINDWVKEMTEGKVQNLVKEDDIKESCMVVINTIFFKFAWAEKYLGFGEGQFTAYNGQAVAVDYLHSDELTRYIKGGNAQGFKQDYLKNHYYFAALLPDEGIDIYDYAASLTGEELQKILKSESEHELDIRFPKFTIKNYLDCKELLKKAGVERIFFQTGDINGLVINNIQPLYIRKIVQETGIELNENGTAAYAATMMTPAMGGPQDPIELNFDRPFLYVIADEEYDIPLFIGIVAGVEPAAGE